MGGPPLPRGRPVDEVDARWSSLRENAVYGMYRCTADGAFVLANPALAAMLGYATEDEVLALSPRRQVL